MAVVINSTTGEIDLDQTTPGIYVVTYTVQGVSYTQEVTVNAVDDATFSYSASAFCVDASNQTPSITTPGGTFTSQDITFRPFQMQFDTSGGKTITIPGTVGSSFTVDWGDTTVTTETGGTISHTYASGRATSTVSIGAQGDTGAFTAFRNANQTSDDVENYLLDIPQWGSIQWSTMKKTFRKATNSSFAISATDTPDFSNLTTIQEMFNQAQMGNISTSGNLANWDVSNVTTLTYLAEGSLNFNPDITGWNTQSVTSAYFPFGSSFNRNLSDWPLNASLTNFGAIFYLTSMSTENYTDSIVGWAVTVYKQSAPYNVSMINQSGRTFDNSRTSDNASGQTYAAKYGSDWPSDPAGENWTDAGDARDYLAGATAGWTISADNRIN